ncbi:MAG: 2-succinyl-5-enolpyruvyl-6-hydroxy-3-cyclohexene-1-carboxylic-acid synthase, partial [Duncaniella dubosii]|nr:2-succinyl-5-enolpyruvyl-6-hydroxy-3-cyclohexene-1-carboxylic-acid synthase [Duncaniella dubosii]
MLTTDKLSCNILADLLVAHGVRHVVLSPGSRNAPLIVALSRRKELATQVVIDERSAGFIALGMTVQSGEPVAIVCTSGSALLNYAPAIAEAFYRCCPLIVISADRPQEWIDQDDSQTIWQQDALSPYVKRSCDLPAHTDFPNGEWVC